MHRRTYVANKVVHIVDHFQDQKKDEQKAVASRFSGVIFDAERLGFGLRPSSNLRYINC